MATLTFIYGIEFAVFCDSIGGGGGRVMELTKELQFPLTCSAAVRFKEDLPIHCSGMVGFFSFSPFPPSPPSPSNQSWS